MSVELDVDEAQVILLLLRRSPETSVRDLIVERFVDKIQKAELEECKRAEIDNARADASRCVSRYGFRRCLKDAGHDHPSNVADCRAHDFGGGIPGLPLRPCAFCTRTNYDVADAVTVHNAKTREVWHFCSSACRARSEHG